MKQDLNKYQNYSNINMDAIDRMRLRPLSIINLFLVGINILVFIIVELTGSSLDTNHMLNWGATYEPLIIQNKEYYRVISSMFLHFGVEHLFNNMLLLFFLGDQLERAVGKWRYLMIYIIGGIGGNICSIISNVILGENVISAGASGAVFAVIGAMIYVLIVNKGRLEDLTFQRLALMAALSLYVGFNSVGVDNVAHIGGMIFGFIVSTIVYKGNKNIKREEQW